MRDWFSLQPGSPALATGPQAAAILGRLRDLSAPYGTVLTIEGAAATLTLPTL